MRAALANSFSASVGLLLGLCLEQDGGGHLGDRGKKGGLIPSSKLTPGLRPGGPGQVEKGRAAVLTHS